MSAPESTAVITPPTPTPPAPAPATAEHDSALHQRLNEIESWLADKFHELLHLVEKAVPAAAAVASPVVAAVEKVAGVVCDLVAFPCCGHDHVGECAKNCPACSKAA